MKKYLIVFLVIIGLVGIITLEQINISQTLTELEQITTQIESRLNSEIDVVNIKTLVDKLDEYWAKKEPIICLSYNHADLENVGKQIKQFKASVYLNDYEQAYTNFELLKHELVGYEHLVLTTIQNIL